MAPNRVLRGEGTTPPDPALEFPVKRHRKLGHLRLRKKVHVAVDGATRLAYVEVLPDEQQSKPLAFWCVRWGDSASRGCPVAGSSRTTALPTAMVPGGRPAGRWR